jgi:small-conductance mechanosensitive channel
MSLTQWMTEIGSALRQYVPTLLGAAALVAVGLICAVVFRWLAAGLVARAFGRFGGRWGLDRAIEDTGTRATVPRVVGGFVFWLVLLFFVAAALESLGLEVVSGVMQRLTMYLPNVLGAVAVILGGVVFGWVLRAVVASGAKSAGLVARAAVLAVAGVIALDQVGVDAQLLVLLIAVVVGAGFAGAGLAFGLGAQTSASNIIASYYLAQTYRVGQTVRIGGLEGRILRTMPAGVLLEGAEGQMLVPAKKFSEEVSVLIAEGS